MTSDTPILHPGDRLTRNGARGGTGPTAAAVRPSPTAEGRPPAAGAPSDSAATFSQPPGSPPRERVGAPRPTVPTMPTRRAFLIAGGAFGVGVSLGGACGYIAGASATITDAAAKAGELDLAAGLAPTGDSDLDELRQWALQDPIEELLRHLPIFLEQMSSTYPSDAYLWHGVARLVDAVLSDAPLQWLPLGKRLLVQTIEGADPERLPPNALPLRDRLHELRGRAR